MDDASICSTNRLRLAVQKQTFLNLLRQNGRNATKVYLLLELTNNRWLLVTMQGCAQQSPVAHGA